MLCPTSNSRFVPEAVIDWVSEPQFSRSREANTSSDSARGPSLGERDIGCGRMKAEID